MKELVNVLMRPLTVDGVVVGAELLPVGISAYTLLDDAWNRVNHRPLNGEPVKVYGDQCVQLMLSQPDAARCHSLARGHSTRMKLPLPDVRIAIKDDGGAPCPLAVALRALNALSAEPTSGQVEDLP